MNCIIVDDDELVRSLLQSIVAKTSFLNLIGTCTNGIEAAEMVAEEKIDLILLDVVMPEMTGIELLKTFGNERPQIILITSSVEYASQAFDFDVTDFIVKPVAYERFLKAVNKAKKIYDAQNVRPIGTTDDIDIFVKVDSRLVKINTRNIFYIEALSDYVLIQTPTERYTIHSTMKSIVEKLPERYFLRVHNSYIVRLDKISAIEDNTLVINSKLIPVSRSNRKDLMQRLKMV